MQEPPTSYFIHSSANISVLPSQFIPPSAYLCQNPGTSTTVEQSLLDIYIYTSVCVCVCVCVCARARAHVHTQSCLTFYDSMDYSQPGSSDHGILQARILEWVAIFSSRRSSQPRDQTHVSFVSCLGRWILYHCRFWAWQRSVDVFEHLWPP